MNHLTPERRKEIEAAVAAEREAQRPKPRIVDVGGSEWYVPAGLPGRDYAYVNSSGKAREHAYYFQSKESAASAMAVFVAESEANVSPIFGMVIDLLAHIDSAAAGERERIVAFLRKEACRFRDRGNDLDGITVDTLTDSIEHNEF